MKRESRKSIYKKIRIEQLDLTIKREMFLLFEQYYDDVSFELFEKDLADKTHVFMLYSMKAELIGFSTIFKKNKVTAKGTRYVSLFSGDTVIRKDYWGTRSLQKAFFFCILESKIKSGLRPLYWFLQSKGHKTYLMMRKNFKHSYPNCKNHIPDQTRYVLNQFYKERYSDNFNEKTGLIEFSTSRGMTKLAFSKTADKYLEDLDTQYFLKRNPGHINGVELACITEIKYSDFFRHIPKYFLGISKKSKKSFQK